MAGTNTASVSSSARKGWARGTRRMHELTPRPATLASWDSIPDDEKPFQRRLMEVFAGFTEHVDVQIGRIVDEIDQTRFQRQHADSLYLG